MTSPSVARPTDNPSNLAVSFLCRYVPMAPDLEGDIDLTKQQPADDPKAPAPDTRPPVDPCINGCA